MPTATTTTTRMADTGSFAAFIAKRKGDKDKTAEEKREAIKAAAKRKAAAKAKRA